MHTAFGSHAPVVVAFETVSILQPHAFHIGVCQLHLKGCCLPLKRLDLTQSFPYFNVPCYVHIKRVVIRNHKHIYAVKSYFSLVMELEIGINSIYSGELDSLSSIDLSPKFQGMPTCFEVFRNRQAFPMEKKKADTTLDFEGQCIYLAAMKRDPNSYEVPITGKALTFPYHMLICRGAQLNKHYI